MLELMLGVGLGLGMEIVGDDSFRGRDGAGREASWALEVGCTFRTDQIDELVPAFLRILGFFRGMGFALGLVLATRAAGSAVAVDDIGRSCDSLKKTYVRLSLSAQMCDLAHNELYRAQRALQYLLHTSLCPVEQECELSEFGRKRWCRGDFLEFSLPPVRRWQRGAPNAFGRVHLAHHSIPVPSVKAGRVGLFVFTVSA